MCVGSIRAEHVYLLIVIVEYRLGGLKGLDHTQVCDELAGKDIYTDSGCHHLQRIGTREKR